MDPLGHNKYGRCARLEFSRECYFWVPKIHRDRIIVLKDTINAYNMDSRLQAFERLLQTMDTLREKCPWDKKQTIQSLRMLTIEETYELADAILESDWSQIEEEVGDLLLHIVFYAKIGSEKNACDIESIIHKLCDKLEERHPHIYGVLEVKDEEEVKKNWEQLKKKNTQQSILQGVPNSLPALIKSYRMQDKVAQVGFDWTKTEDVWAKIREEMDEFEAELATGSAEDRESEFGDILFSLTNLARHYKIDPESALERTNKKFKRRFQAMEQYSAKDLSELSMEELDDLWNTIKRKEKS